MKLHVTRETWPLAKPFVISRGRRDHADVVVATLEAGGRSGRGEGVPYPRYGESVDGVVALLQSVAARLEQGEPWEALLASLPAGAARNALDCAYWDWRCKRAERRITDLLGEPPLAARITAYTLSIDEPAAMEQAAREHAHRPVLKIKTGGERVIASVEAVRRGAPASTLLVDANEAWPPAELAELLAAMASLGVALVEQPLRAGEDELLARLPRPVPVYADESFHTAADFESCRGKYDGVNLKLDKAGGLTEGRRIVTQAREQGLGLLCGCMLGTSLAMAPALVLAQSADYVDLDGPLLLARDRPDGIRFEDSLMHPFAAALWG